VAKPNRKNRKNKKIQEGRPPDDFLITKIEVGEILDRMDSGRRAKNILPFRFAF